MTEINLQTYEENSLKKIKKNAVIEIQKSYDIGYTLGWTEGNISGRTDSNDTVDRLTELVKAQREYILWLQLVAREISAEELELAINLKDKIEKYSR